jgi:hypothetical protein
MKNGSGVSFAGRDDPLVEPFPFQLGVKRKP